jgi:alpha-galactosidase
MVDINKFKNASSYRLKDLWTGEVTKNVSGIFTVTDIDAYDNVTLRVTPI